jgi:PAS domain S-box-containing protein
VRRLPGPAGHGLSDGGNSRGSFGLFRDWQRTQTQSSVRTLRSLRQQMDVRFCEEQEPQAERHHYVTGILIRRFARSPERAQKSCAFLLTMTYMDARHPGATRLASGKPTFRGLIVRLETAKGCHKVFDRAEFFNRRWLDYAGLSIEETRNWGWTAAVHADDLARLADYWRSILSSGEPGEIEARLRRFDGEYRWFLFRAEPVRDDHGDIFKWYDVNTDIEDRRRAEALLAAEKRTLEMVANGARVGGHKTKG